MYEEQKHALANGKKDTNNNLITLLVRASQEVANESSQGLTESEIYGNMFTFNFAGHDTTAHGSTLDLYFLAANTEVQDWIFEEIQTILGGRKPHQLDHRADYLLFKRCLAVLNETLRLDTVVPVLK